MIAEVKQGEESQKENGDHHNNKLKVQRLTGKAPPEEKTLLCKWLCKRRILYCLKVGLFLLIGPLFRLLFAKVNIRPRGSPMVFGVQCVK